MEYRGITLSDSVKLRKKDGSYYVRTKSALDKLADIIIERGDEILSKYSHEKEKILIDFKCGHEPYWIYPYSYRNVSKGCIECANKMISETKMKEAKDEFPLMLKENGHELLGRYKGNHKKVLIDFKCEIHEPQITTPSNYKRAEGRCPRCSKASVNDERVKIAGRELALIVDANGHELLSEYKTTHTNVLINFNCEHKPQWIAPSNYKKRGTCPECRESKGAREVRLFLEDNHIKFIREYSFEDLHGVGGELLRFDFAILNEHNNLEMLIEYDGEFHDMPILGEEKLVYQQTHDRIKNLYCEHKGINLLRIHYSEFDNIKNILSAHVARKVVM
ncbi:hypothetical protein P4639_22580 [Priestia megaterium]|uniref:hypothetical protein n=1 Tax=Priestia megaterium TaxID=1404 RepID=UPI002E1BC769|nr:hypothetical protein [Priestia megaterium]